MIDSLLPMLACYWNKLSFLNDSCNGSDFKFHLVAYDFRCAQNVSWWKKHLRHDGNEKWKKLHIQLTAFNNKNNKHCIDTSELVTALLRLFQIARKLEFCIKQQILACNFSFKEDKKKKKMSRILKIIVINQQH